MNFINLIDQTHQTLQQNAVKAVNGHVTLRNWLIGCYIVEIKEPTKRKFYELSILETNNF